MGGLSSVCQRKSQISHQEGVSLMEVLVALVLVSMVTLTVAVSAIRAQAGQQQALETTLATAAGEDLIERIRANPSQRLSYAFNKAVNAACPSDDNNLAERDLSDWCGRVNNRLPDFAAELVFDPDDDWRLQQLRLSWQARTGGGYLAQGGRAEVVWDNVQLRVAHGN